MNLLPEWLNTPIFTTLVSLVIGGFLLSWLSDRRANKDKIREKAIELLTETSIEINAVTDHIFRIILSGKVDEESLAGLNEQVNLVMRTRMNVNIRSMAYLKGAEFYPKYELLVWQLHRLRELFNELSKQPKDADFQPIVTTLQSLKAQLIEKWPHPATMGFVPPELNFPYDEFFKFMDPLVDRALELFSSHLKSAMK